MAKYYDELLNLCGFEGEEINRERPRIERAFHKMELGPTDMEVAQTWVKQNHDVQLLGVRKMLRLWLKELIDLVMARDEGRKLVYYGFPTIMGPAGAIAEASDEIFCTCPDIVLCHTVGHILNKIGSIIEAGEENGLPPGHALCSLQQVRVGGMAKGIIPVPDLALTSSYYCDMGSKTDELLHERYGHPAVYIDGSMDSKWGEFPDYLPDRVDYLGGQIENMFAKVKEVLGVEITVQARQQGASRGREIASALSELLKLIRGADPQPISAVTVELARLLAIGSASKRILNEGPEAIAILNKEVKERIGKGVGVVGKGAPKVMLFLSHYSDPRIVHMIEDCGLSIPVTFFAEVTAKFRKSTPFISGEVLAKEEMARGTYHSNYGFIKRAAGVIREASLDGFIWNYLYNCRPLSQPSYLLKQFVEKETRVPVLALEFDLSDSRTYSPGALKTRVETFAEMLRARKLSGKDF